MSEFKREEIEEKNRILKEKIKQREIQRNQIQNLFDFKIPVYVLDEIIESKDRVLKDNLNAIINLARVNDRISLSEAKILKNHYVFDNTSNEN